MAWSLLKTLSILSGGYGLVEMYCEDPKCDCRRVMFSVVSEREHSNVAVINFGWENEKFYEEWLGSKDKIMINELKGPSLNSASRQSKYAPELLKVVCDVVLKDKYYIERIKRHYKIFKEKLREDNLIIGDEIGTSAEYKIGRNDPCPCASGKKYKKCCGG